MGGFGKFLDMISFVLGDIVSRCTGMTLRRYNYLSDNKVQTSKPQQVGTPTTRNNKHAPLLSGAAWVLRARGELTPVANENGLGSELIARS